MSYLLGDNDIAARRLKIVAEIFAPSTEAFLLDVNPLRPELTLDLGCGPGHTTRLLARTLKGSTAIGMDSSEKFIGEAVGSQNAKGISFYRHDVTKTPFPVGPADVIFSRYVLLHLESPHSTVGKWITQLKTGGLLLLEELEQIQTSENLFQKYVNLLDRSLATQDKTMFIGPTIASVPLDGAKIKLNRVKEIKVSAKDAATMFLMNMLTLRKSPHVRALYHDEEINQFMGDLERVMDEKTTMAAVDWQLRQVVIQRN